LESGAGGAKVSNARSQNSVRLLKGKVDLAGCVSVSGEGHEFICGRGAVGLVAGCETGLGITQQSLHQ
jgi:hypothetical protein